MSFRVPEACRLPRPHRDGRYASKKGDSFGMFLVPRFILIIASDGKEDPSCPRESWGWQHVSVSVKDKGSAFKSKLPTWDEMCHIKGLFWENGDCVVQYHPPEADYVERALAVADPSPAPDIARIVERYEDSTDPIMLALYNMHAIWLQGGRLVYDLADGVPERLMAVEPQWGDKYFSAVIRLPKPITVNASPTEDPGFSAVAFYLVYTRGPHSDLDVHQKWTIGMQPLLVDDATREGYWGKLSVCTEGFQPLPEQEAIFRLAVNAVYALTNEKVGRTVPMALGLGERRKRQKAGQHLACRRLELPESANKVFTTVRDVVRASPPQTESAKPPPPEPPVEPVPAIPSIERSAAIVPAHKGLRWMLEGHCSEADILLAMDQGRCQERPGKPLLIAVPRPIKGYVRGEGQIRSHAARVVLARE